MEEKIEMIRLINWQVKFNNLQKRISLLECLSGKTYSFALLHNRDCVIRGYRPAKRLVKHIEKFYTW